MHSHSLLRKPGFAPLLCKFKRYNQPPVQALRQGHVDMQATVLPSHGYLIMDWRVAKSTPLRIWRAIRFKTT